MTTNKDEPLDVIAHPNMLPLRNSLANRLREMVDDADFALVNERYHIIAREAAEMLDWYEKRCAWYANQLDVHKAEIAAAHADVRATQKRADEAEALLAIDLRSANREDI